MLQTGNYYLQLAPSFMWSHIIRDKFKFQNVRCNMTYNALRINWSSSGYPGYHCKHAISL